MMKITKIYIYVGGIKKVWRRYKKGLNRVNKNLWKEASMRVPSRNQRTAGGGSPGQKT